MAETIEFGSLSAARAARNNPNFRPFLADEDDARTATVVVEEGTPEAALDDLQGEAADSLAYKADRYGQAELSRAEKSRIDFSSGRANVMHARSVKAIARGKGVDDWTSFYDPTLSVDEHRSLMEQATKDDRGRRDLGRDPDSEEAHHARVARAHHQRKQAELPHAKRAGFQGDPDAQAFVREQGPLGEVFDVRYSRDDEGQLQGSGEDYDRLQDVHEERSDRARTLDGKKQAPVTRDPYQWVNAPSRWDFIGIDDVRPAELHAARSDQAQAIDERSAAPLTDDPQVWAMNPERYDYEGVDDADPARLHAARSQRARTIDEQEIAPIADSPQQWAMHPGRYDWRGVDMPATYGPLGSTPIPEEDRGVPWGGPNDPEGVATVSDEALDALAGYGIAEDDLIYREEPDARAEVRSRRFYGVDPTMYAGGDRDRTHVFTPLR